MFIQCVHRNGASSPVPLKSLRGEKLIIHPYTASLLALVPIRFSLQAQSTFRHIFSVSFHVTTQRCDRFRELFMFVLDATRHFIDGDVSEGVCFRLVRSVINFCFSRVVTQKN